MSDSSSDINNGSVSAFLLQFAITGATLVVFFSAFCILRPRNGLIYQSRLKLEPNHDYPDLGKGLIGWIWKLLRVPESKVIECAGYDAAVYQRLSLLGVEIFAFCSIYGLCVLLPVYITACDGDNCQPGLNRLSMSNVPSSKNAVMIAPLISVYMFSLFAYWILHRAYRDFQALRLHFLAQRQPYSYTCLVKEMPAEDASDEALAKLFNFTSNGNVDYAAVGRNCKDLQKAYDRREFYVKKLERALWDFNNSPEKTRPQHKTGFLGLTGKKVDSIDFYTQKLDKYNTRVADLQAANPPTSGTGFVTFKNLTSAAAAPQLLYSNNTAEYALTAAPHPDDVYWPNMTVYGKELLTRRLIVTGIVIFLVFFYTIPVAFIQSFMNMETLVEIFGQSFVDFINDVPGLQAVLEGILPTLAMTIFMALLPPLCYWLSIFEGWKSQSGLERQQLIKLYYFQLFNVFLITALSGSVLNQMQSIIDDPTSLVNSLAVGLPNSANFFINYVMLLAFGGWGAALLQIVRLLIVWIKLKWLAKTPRERQDAVNPGPFKYSAAYGVDLLVWAIGFTYATIAPIILPFVITYFVFGGFTNKYLTMYVSMPTYESGGRFFPMVFNRILVGMLVYQVMMVGIFSLKKSWICFALIPLPFFTMLFYWLENKFWYMPSKFMPLKLAREMDDANQDAGETGEGAVDSIDCRKYLQPCLKTKAIAPETWDAGAKPSFENEDGMGADKASGDNVGPTPSDVQMVDDAGEVGGAQNKKSTQDPVPMTV